MCLLRGLSWRRRLRLPACAVLFFASAAMVAWGLWPPTSETISLQLEREHMAEPSTGAAANPTGTAKAPSADPRPLDQGVTLAYPRSLRVEDAGLVRLRLADDQPGELIPAPGSHRGGARSAATSAPAEPAPQTMIAEARLDLPGAQVRPFDAISEPLLPGVPVEFVWSVRISEPTQHRGTAWLFLVIVEKSTLAQERYAISAQSLDIAGNSFLGMNGPLARAGGGVGLIGSLLLALPLVDDVLRWLSGRLRAAI